MKTIILRNNKTLVIREAVKSDAALLLDSVHTSCGETDFLTFGPDESGFNLEGEESYIESQAQKDNALLIVAEVDRKIVGSLGFSGGPRPRNKHTGEFGITVIMDYWGLGIGEALIRYLIEWAKGSGVVRKINLRVRTDNVRAIELYTRLGFVNTGTITRDFKMGDMFYDSYTMGMEID